MPIRLSAYAVSRDWYLINMHQHLPDFRRTTTSLETIHLLYILFIYIAPNMSYASYNTEQDPLLPKEKQSPEVMGSRPKTEADVEGNEGEDVDDFDPKRHLLNDIMAMVFAVAVLFSILFMFLPDGFLGDEPAPKTIEQRVHRILVETPLIGSILTIHP